jgi:hypothetical protein
MVKAAEVYENLDGAANAAAEIEDLFAKAQLKAVRLG